MSELKSELFKFTSRILLSKNLRKLQGLDESQKTLSTRKLAFIVDDIENEQRQDAIFLRRVIDHITKLEAQINNN